MIKDTHLKIIASADMSLSAINLFDNNLEPFSTNNGFEAATFEPKPTIEKTINGIKCNLLEIITFIDMNVSAITSNTPYSSYEHIKYDIIPWILLLLPGK